MRIKTKLIIADLIGALCFLSVALSPFIGLYIFIHFLIKFW